MCMVTEDSFETKTEGTDGKQSKCAAIVLRGKIYSRSDEYQGKYSPLSALCHPQVTQ